MKRFGKLLIPLNRRYVDTTVVTRLVFGKISITLTVCTQTLDIYLLDGHGVLSQETLTFAQHIAVLRYIRTA